VPALDPRGGRSFGERLASLVREHAVHGVVVLGTGSVPLLRDADARHLVAAAASSRREALTNNRYSSDVCAVACAGVLCDLPPLPSDNALPRWLEERAGYVVSELAGRARLALDLDSPLDLATLALSRSTPAAVRRLAAADGLRVPRLDALRAIAADRRRELLVAGRAGSSTLRWLERSVACRVRFLAEERGLRSACPLAQGADAAVPATRPPRSTLGRLLAERGPEALGSILAELCDGAVLDSRVLIADRLGADEARWPIAEDRFASDLGRVEAIGDPWLRALTAAAVAAPVPVLLGGHTTVGPGLRLLLG
jgi:hypothetical protein